MKKHLWALILMVASSSIHAGMYLVCHSIANQVPCKENAWDVDGEGLYFRNGSNAFVGAVNTRNVNSPLSFRPDSAWGFRVEASYHFGNGNDFTVNWSHYKESTSAIDDLGALFATPGTDYTMRSEFDIINFELAQHLDFGDKVKLRLQAGIQINTLREFWNQVLAAGTTLTDGNKQKGWGPRAGIEGTYEILSGLLLYSKGALGILSMKQDISSDPNNNVFWRADETVYNIIPETELSFGVKYYEMLPQGTLTMKVAWEEIAYINASFGNASLAWDGLSVGVKWIGNA